MSKQANHREKTQKKVLKLDIQSKRALADFIKKTTLKTIKKELHEK